MYSHNRLFISQSRSAVSTVLLLLTGRIHRQRAMPADENLVPVVRLPYMDIHIDSLGMHCREILSGVHILTTPGV